MPKHARVKEQIDVFDCEGCKASLTLDDVAGRITYMNGLYGFWCFTCWKESHAKV